MRIWGYFGMKKHGLLHNEPLTEIDVFFCNYMFLKCNSVTICNPFAPLPRTHHSLVEHLKTSVLNVAFFGAS